MNERSPVSTTQGLMTAARSRLLSITFDDGVLHGSKVACDILAKHDLAATFYVVTGWVEPGRAAIRERCNASRAHGDWSHWRRVAAAGHEVGSHTFSHINIRGKKAALFPWLVERELRSSLQDLKREVPQAVYTISMPWNAASCRSERLVPRFYSACRLGGSSVAYNYLAVLNQFSLNSWAPSSSTPLSQFKRAVDAIPEGGWLMLQFHSFDDEGYEPVSRATFQAVCDFVASETDVVVAPVSRVVIEAMS